MVPRRRLLLSSIALLIVVPLGLGWVPVEKAKRVIRATKRPFLILSGGLVDVGGRRLRIDCKGAGSPTVVMDAGLDMTHSTWGTVPRDVARFTRICTYDRAGLGDSDGATPTPRTSGYLVVDLHALLRTAGEREPFLLVGHSFGGLNARLYASRYPEQIAGLVLVDSSHEDQYERYAALKPPGEREKYLKHEGGANYERVDLLSSAEEIRRARPLPRIPIIVLTARPAEVTPQEARELEVHYGLQATLARLLPGSRLIFVPKSGHFIQRDRPEAVVESIRDVYARSKEPTLLATPPPPTVSVMVVLFLAAGLHATILVARRYHP